MVREILSADIKISGMVAQLKHIFKAAIAWGDKSIIQDLISTFSHQYLDYVVVSSTLEWGKMELFDFLLKSKLVSEEALTRCLAVAITIL